MHAVTRLQRNSIENSDLNNVTPSPTTIVKRALNFVDYDDPDNDPLLTGKK